MKKKLSLPIVAISSPQSRQLAKAEKIRLKHLFKQNIGDQTFGQLMKAIKTWIGSENISKFLIIGGVSDQFFGNRVGRFTDIDIEIVPTSDFVVASFITIGRTLLPPPFFLCLWFSV